MERIPEKSYRTEVKTLQLEYLEKQLQAEFAKDKLLNLLDGRK